LRFSLEVPTRQPRPRFTSHLVFAHQLHSSRRRFLRFLPPVHPQSHPSRHLSTSSFPSRDVGTLGSVSNPRFRGNSSSSVSYNRRIQLPSSLSTPSATIFDSPQSHLASRTPSSRQVGSPFLPHRSASDGFSSTLTQNSSINSAKLVPPGFSIDRESRHTLRIAPSAFPYSSSFPRSSHATHPRREIPHLARSGRKTSWRSVRNLRKEGYRGQIRRISSRDGARRKEEDRNDGDYGSEGEKGSVSIGISVNVDRGSEHQKIHFCPGLGASDEQQLEILSIVQYKMSSAFKGLRASARALYALYTRLAPAGLRN